MKRKVILAISVLSIVTVGGFSIGKTINSKKYDDKSETVKAEMANNELKDDGAKDDGIKTDEVKTDGVNEEGQDIKNLSNNNTQKEEVKTQKATEGTAAEAKKETSNKKETTTKKETGDKKETNDQKENQSIPGVKPTAKCEKGHVVALKFLPEGTVFTKYAGDQPIGFTHESGCIDVGDKLDCGVCVKGSEYVESCPNVEHANKAKGYGEA